MACERCERLWRVLPPSGREKRAAFRDWDYWGRPVPNFGDPPARLLIVGLVPAAHGANRTGRMFTGDRSGEWLYRALHRAGFANQSESVDRDDGLQLIDCAITAAAHCAPPGNKPLPEELANCHEWFARTIDFVADQGASWRWARSPGEPRSSKPAAAAGMRDHCRSSVTGRTWHWPAAAGCWRSYHPSQQNTFTGVLTEQMLDAVFATARGLLK